MYLYCSFYKQHAQKGAQAGDIRDRVIQTERSYLDR
jgi:hypothetical protein